ncbi:hypothetical protein AOQ84DRAFT_305905 [Neofusicoccum parvum]|uniref:Uncharacterized protein n=1 Tax=Neofusicoccum parvum TaxID=310453 RepID=A0ACB5S074_9PEZI|nr:hypothetical protein AOQ84DRAFT_305905 [Neofusicoccum parvum]
MAMAAQEMESRPINKRKRPDVRKKNIRFEIPPERSLLNIDQLIAQSTNEEEIKELKQQKRLLRNRQAALDSRQRKEKITEELEKEKKLWTERIFQRKDDLQSMRPQLEAKQPIEIQQWQKEEIVRTHTLVTGELRKEISILTDRLRS